MTVYVDDVRYPFGRMIMCHLWADTREELLVFVDRLGLNPKWLQQPPKASWVHFDVSLGMKAKAIALGAVLTDRYGPVEHCMRLDLASGDPDLISYATRKLEQIGRCRAKFAATDSA